MEKNKEYGEIVSQTGSFPCYNTFLEKHLSNSNTIIVQHNFENLVLPRKNIREILYDQPVTKVFRWNLRFCPESDSLFVPKAGPPNLQIEFVTDEIGFSISNLLQRGKVIAQGIQKP